MRSVLYTTDHNGREVRIQDDQSRVWQSSYGHEGSGFGYLIATLSRYGNRDYADIGYGYRIQLCKGPYNTLFDGEIVAISQRQGEIEITALGFLHVFHADVHNYVYCDTRTTKWESDEIPNGSFTPNKFDWDTQGHLYLKPRRGETSSLGTTFMHEGDYTSLKYDFQFGEMVKRIQANYDIALPNAFPAKAQLYAGDTVLWELGETGSGSLDISTSGHTTVEFRLTMTADGDVTAEDDTVYALFDKVKVYSRDVPLLDAYHVAANIVDQLSAPGHGLKHDFASLGAPGVALEPSAFDTDRTPADVLTWCCQFGDNAGSPLAWGVKFDDTKRVFLASQNMTEVKYIVKDNSVDIERRGDWSESAQVVYGVYQDNQGRQVRTGDIIENAMIRDLGGKYYRKSLHLTGVSNPEAALSLLQTYLAENANPASSGTYLLKGTITKPDGRMVPLDEVQPGGLVQIPEWRAVEADFTGDDFRDNVTTFMLVATKYDEEQGVLEMVPASTSNLFTRQMARISELGGQNG